MKTIIITAILLFLSLTTYSQNCDPSCVPNWTNKLNLSTGLNANGTLIATLPTIDPFWKLVNVAPPSVNGANNIQIPNAHAIGPINNYPSWCQINGTRAISAVPTPFFATNNDDSNQPWRFRRQFCVCENSNVKIEGNFRADDAGRVLLYRITGGVAVVSTLITLPPPPQTDNFFTDHPFNQVINLVQGEYFIEVELSNTDQMAMGFALQCNLSETTDKLTLGNPGPCCHNGLISVTKVLDNDCDGLYTPGDALGQNWMFSLYSNGTLLESQYTNQYGEVIFSGLPMGTYTITEHTQTGWAPNPPQSTSQTVSIGAGGGAMVEFFNCPDSTYLCCEIDSIQVSWAPIISLSGNPFVLNVSSGSVPIQEIDISVVDYHVTYNHTDCKPANMGVFGNLSSTTANIGGLVLQNNNEHSLSWISSNPATLNHTIRLSLSKPNLLNIPCCNGKFFFCLKVRIKDNDCNVCEKLICRRMNLRDFTIIPHDESQIKYPD